MVAIVAKRRLGLRHPVPMRSMARIGTGWRASVLPRSVGIRCRGFCF